MLMTSIKSAQWGCFSVRLRSFWKCFMRFNTAVLIAQVTYELINGVLLHVTPSTRRYTHTHTHTHIPDVITPWGRLIGSSLVGSTLSEGSRDIVLILTRRYRHTHTHTHTHASTYTTLTARLEWAGAASEGPVVATWKRLQSIESKSFHRPLISCARVRR